MNEEDVLLKELRELIQEKYLVNRGNLLKLLDNTRYIPQKGDDSVNVCRNYRAAIQLTKYRFPAYTTAAAILFERDWTQILSGIEMSEEFLQKLQGILNAAGLLEEKRRLANKKEGEFPVDQLMREMGDVEYLAFIMMLELYSDRLHFISSNDTDSFVTYIQVHILAWIKCMKTHEYERRMENDIFRITKPISYQPIHEQRNQVYERNMDAISAAEGLLKSAHFDCLYSIARTDKELYDESNRGRKRWKTIPLAHEYLIFHGIDQKLAATQWMHFYRDTLLPEKYCLLDYIADDPKLPPHYILEDRYRIRYRIFVMEYYDYKKYCFGRRIGNIDEEGIFKQNPMSIAVYDKSQKQHIVRYGMSALDFAFKISENVGLCAKKIYVNGTEVPFDTILQEGDMIYIEGDSKTMKYEAQLQWFRYVNTARARDYLITYFQRMMEDRIP